MSPRDFTFKQYSNTRIKVWIFLLRLSKAKKKNQQLTKTDELKKTKTKPNIYGFDLFDFLPLPFTDL